MVFHHKNNKGVIYCMFDMQKLIFIKMNIIILKIINKFHKEIYNLLIYDMLFSKIVSEFLLIISNYINFA